MGINIQFSDIFSNSHSKILSNFGTKIQIFLTLRSTNLRRVAPFLATRKLIYFFTDNLYEAQEGSKYIPLEHDSGDSAGGEEVPNLNRLENSPDHFGSNDDANHESGSGYAECAEYDEACNADVDGSGGKK